MSGEDFIETHGMSFYSIYSYSKVSALLYFFSDFVGIFCRWIFADATESVMLAIIIFPSYIKVLTFLVCLSCCWVVLLYCCWIFWIYSASHRDFSVVELLFLNIFTHAIFQMCLNYCYCCPICSANYRTFTVLELLLLLVIPCCIPLTTLSAMVAYSDVVP